MSKDGGRKIFCALTSSTEGNTALFSPGGSTVYTKTEVGSSIGRFYGYLAHGIYQNPADINASFEPNAKPGDIRCKDLDKNSVLDANDRTYIGSPLPKFSYGLSGNVSYKNVDFSMLCFGVPGNNIANSLIPAMNAFANTTTEALSRWSPAYPNTYVPRAVIGDPNQNSLRFSSRWIQSGSFLRLRNVTLGYRLPDNLINRIGLSNIRVYVSAQNLVTITKYKGYDFEAGGSASAAFAYFVSGNLLRGFDRGTYPLAKTLLCGIQIGF